MNLNEFIVIAVLVLNEKWCMGLSHTNSMEVRAEIRELETTSTTKKLDIKGIQKWADVGHVLSQASVATDSESIIRAIKSLSKALPHLGSILNVLSSMVSKTNGFEEIKEEFRKMDSRLFAIENKIEVLSTFVTATSTLSYYKTKSESIELIQRSYQRYLRANTIINMHNLIDECEQNKILHYVYYVHKELSETTIPSLMIMMKDDNNLANFQSWMKMLVASISQSMMLHTICMFAQYHNSPGINETIDDDISYFKNVSDIMLKVVKEGTNDIKRDFFETAKAEIDLYASVNARMSHEDFSSKVWEMLVKKYFWRGWFVASYDQEKYGFGNHYVTWNTQYVYAWFRKYDRNVNVVHTNNNDYGIENKLKTCMENKKWSTNELYAHSSNMCKWASDYVETCIGNTNSLGVINIPIEFDATWSDGIAATYSVFSKYSPTLYGFRVFVVAPEK